MKHKRSTLLAMLAAGSLALLHGAPATADLIEWDGGAAGDFDVDGNWNPAQKPTVDDDVLFDAVTTTVTFNADEFSNSLEIINASDVTFELGGFTYAITENVLVDNSSFTILNGTLTAASLTVDNGGDMTVGADATLNVEGGETLIVGDEGAGDLVIAADGTVNANTLIVGNQFDGGDGFVDIQVGGTLNTGNAIIGNEADPDGVLNPATGQVDVAGEWNNDETIIVGNEGDGVVNVTAGGVVNTASMILGAEETGDGTLNIGADAEVNVTGNATLTVGGLGTGLVDIAADGTLNSVNATVGMADGSTGTVEVDGTWNNSGTVLVGSDDPEEDGGTGVVNVNATGQMTTQNLVVGDGGTVTQVAGGVLVISDAIADESLDPMDPDFIGPGLHVGAEGTGSLTVVGGGQVNIDEDAVIGSNGGTGTVTVSGDDGDEMAPTASTLAIGGDLTVGDEGDGELNVQGGGSVTVTGDANIGANADGGTGTVTVDGTADPDDEMADVSTLDIGGTLVVGFDAMNDGAVDEGDVNATLMVTNGALVNVGGDATVHETGRFGGDGTIDLNNGMGTLTVFGRLSPGASIGTLTIDGNLVMEDGSILEIDYSTDPHPIFDELVDANVLDSDLVVVTGTATFADGSTLHVIQLTGTGVAPGSILVIMQAPTIEDNGDLNDNLVVNGTPFVVWTAMIIDDTDEDHPAFGDPLSDYAGEEFLVLVSALDVDQAVFDELGRNIGALGVALAAAWEDGELLDILGALPDLDDPAFAQGLQSLLPLQHGAATRQNLRAAQHYNNSFMHEMAAHRSGLGGVALGGGTSMIASSAHDPAALAQAIDSLDTSEDPDSIAFAALQQGATFGGFIRGMGHWERVDSDGTDRTGHNARVAGVLLGVHTNLSPDFLIGLSFGYLNTDMDFRRGFGDGEIDTFRVGPYLSWTPGGGDFFVDAAASYGYHRNEIDRNVTLPAPATARSRYTAHDLSILGQAGFNFTVFDRTILTPMAGLEYTRLSTESFRERGAGSANLAVRSQSNDSLRLRLGAKLAHAIDMAGLTLVPEIYAGWAHELMDQDVDIRSRFIAGGPSFRTRTTGVGRNSFQLAAGVSALVTPNTSLFVRYEGEFQSDRRSHGVVGGVNLNF